MCWRRTRGCGDEESANTRRMRLLLLNVPGARSYEELRTDVDGNVLASFNDAAKARHLFPSDKGLVNLFAKVVQVMGGNTVTS